MVTYDDDINFAKELDTFYKSTAGAMANSSTEIADQGIPIGTILAGFFMLVLIALVLLLFFYAIYRAISTPMKK